MIIIKKLLIKDTVMHARWLKIYQQYKISYTDHMFEMKMSSSTIRKVVILAGNFPSPSSLLFFQHSGPMIIRSEKVVLFRFISHSNIMSQNSSTHFHSLFWAELLG